MTRKRLTKDELMFIQAMAWKLSVDVNEVNISAIIFTFKDSDKILTNRHYRCIEYDYFRNKKLMRLII